MTIEIDLGSNIPAAPAKRQKRAPIGMPKLTRIILDDNEEIPPTGLFMQHNGTPYILKSGVEADVPEGIIDILNHAVVSRPVRNPQTQQVTHYRDGLRFSYRIVKRPSEE